VVAVLREKREATAPEISALSGHSVPSIKSAVRALYKEGRLTKRPAPPGAGNRVYLSLSGDEAWAAGRAEAGSKISSATTNGDHEGLDEGGCDHDR
jgi:DNA-binding MarR family transcriptional regulator